MMRLAAAAVIGLILGATVTSLSQARGELDSFMIVQRVPPILMDDAEIGTIVATTGNGCSEELGWERLTVTRGRSIQQMYMAFNVLTDESGSLKDESGRPYSNYSILPACVKRW